jgi:hypothetical protein
LRWPWDCLPFCNFRNDLDYCLLLTCRFACLWSSNTSGGSDSEETDRMSWCSPLLWAFNYNINKCTNNWPINLVQKITNGTLTNTSINQTYSQYKLFRQQLFAYNKAQV